MTGITAIVARLVRPERYGPVLLLLALTLLSGAVARPRLGGITAAVLSIGLWLAVCSAAQLTRRARRTGLVVGAAIVAVALTGAALEADGLRCVADLSLAGAVAVLAVIIGRSVARATAVTLSSVAALLCLYLLIGLFFAQLYIAVADVSDTAFASSIDPLGRFDLVYFSFVALTTVGFGDITPVVNLTQALSVTESVMGQIFLVTVVAAAVARLGQDKGDRELVRLRAGLRGDEVAVEEDHRGADERDGDDEDDGADGVDRRER